MNDSFEDDKSSKAKSYNSDKKSKFHARNLLKATTCGLKSEPLIPDRKAAYENEVKFIESLANHKYQDPLVDVKGQRMEVFNVRKRSSANLGKSYD